MLYNWQKDAGRFPNSVENYLTFGLLNYYPNIVELLDNYSPITTERETLGTFVVFNEEGKDVAAVVLDHVTYDDKSTTLAVFHLLTRPDEQGKGYGNAIMHTIIKNADFIFNRKVDEVCTSVNTYNDFSRKVMERNGMHIECTSCGYNMFSVRLNENKLPER